MYRWIRCWRGRDARTGAGSARDSAEEVAGQVEHVLLAGAGRNPHSHGRELEQDRAHGSAPLRQPHGAVRPQPHRSLELHVLQRLSHALIRQPQVTRRHPTFSAAPVSNAREPLPRTFHVTAFFGVLLALQAQSIAAAPTPPSATTVRATRTAVAPVLDGRDDDVAWRSAPAIDQFLEARPTEGAKPRLRTEARVAYDEHNLYVFVRAFDPHPDSIVALLSRRDDQTASDYVTLMLDPYHDRRTGYEFSVNPAGVKTDYAIYNDGDEDIAWDAVWDAATRIDSLGWTAEYRIPLSQLHYSSKGGGTFGLLIWRVVQRHTATITWPLYRISRSGLTSQFGDPHRTRRTGQPGPRGDHAVRRHQERDRRRLDRPRAEPGRHRRRRPQYRLASNLLLNATINPDFGQVEADPSELNLSAFETFFSERRPFFVEGRGCSPSP